MVRALQDLPRAPRDRVQLVAGVPFLTEHELVHDFHRVYGPVLLPELDQHGHQVGRVVSFQLVLVAVVLDRQHVVLAHAVLACFVPYVVKEHPLLQDDVRLALHVAVVPVAEEYVDVLQQLCRDHAGHVHAALSVRVEVEVHTGVAVNALVALRGARLRLQTQPLDHLVNLVGQHVGDRLGVLVCHESKEPDRPVLGAHLGNTHAHHAPEEVDHRLVHVVSVHAAPLVADIEVLVAGVVLIQPDGLLVLLPSRELFADLAGVFCDLHAFFCSLPW